MDAWSIALLSITTVALLAVVLLGALSVKSWDRPPDPLERSRSLLLQHLTPKQRKQFERDKTFTVVSNLGNKFCIHPKTAYGIHNSTQVFCALPPRIPIYDTMLAQKLLLETDEQAFIEVAYSNPMTSVDHQRLGH